MIDKSTSKGFSTIELLITLFIGAVFLIAGYQLYAVIIKDGGEARAQLKAYNAADDYVQRYKYAVGSPNCSSTIPGLPTNSSVSINGLSNTIITVAITCPYSTTSPVSKITATLNYGTSPQQTITSSTYVTP